MRNSLKLYVTSHRTGELLGTRDAVTDVKQPERWIIPPYQTLTDLPNEILDDNEYWAYLDANNKPVRDYQLGAWMKKKRFIKVTAYLKSDATKQKEFDDESLLTDGYTVSKPSSQFDEWINDSWITNLSNKYIADYDAVDNTRRALYREISDPLYMESYRKKENGLLEEAALFKAQADAAVEKIQAEHPFPIAPVI